MKILTLTQAKAVFKDQLLFEPSWGEFDIAVGTQIVSAYGGPADRSAYGETEDFSRKLVPRRVFPDDVMAKHKIYEDVRILLGLEQPPTNIDERFFSLIDRSSVAAPSDWLIQVELLEAAEKLKASSEVVEKIESTLKKLGAIQNETGRHIEDARRTLHLGN